jgi:hypothetical protein
MLSLSTLSIVLCILGLVAMGIGKYSFGKTMPIRVGWIILGNLLLVAASFIDPPEDTSGYWPMLAAFLLVNAIAVPGKGDRAKPTNSMAEAIRAQKDMH